MKSPVGAARRPTLRRDSPSDNLVWSSSRPWWVRYAVGNAEYLSYEADARRVREWAVLRVPDLLCIPEYTRALLYTDRVFCTRHLVGGRLDNAGDRRLRDEIDSRRERLDRLVGRPDRPIDEYIAVVEEAALRKVVGDVMVMRAQLQALVDLGGWASVTVRVVPEKARAQVDTDGGFTLLEFPDPLQEPLLVTHYPGGVVLESEPSIVDSARQRFDAVLSVALPKPDSLELIEQLTDQLYPE